MSVLKKIEILCLTMLLLAIPVVAQTPTTTKTWEEKPVAEWGEADIKAILQNSSWSKTVEGKPSHTSPQLGTVMYTSHVQFTLRSALVVRLAVVRAEQLKAKYDSMDASAKAEFNNKFKPVLDCSLCEKSYIVAVRGMSDMLQLGAKIKNRAPDIYLSNEKGERRELSNFTPRSTPEGEALFYFHRYDASGKALLTAESKTLTFNFVSRPDDDATIQLLNRIDVKVADIVREGQVIF